MGLLTPSQGSITAGFAAASDFGSMEVTEQQQTESVAAYGNAVYDPYRASGTPHMSVSCGGFAKANANNTQPFGDTGGLTNAGGANTTFTLATGVTLAGTFVISQVKLTHARLRAAVPLTWQMECSGDVTTTWPTS